MYFQELHERLVDTARTRVRSGQVSERSLAHRSGISQPHLHNVLKRIRSLTPDSADRLLRGLGITVADLLWQPYETTDWHTRAIPVLRQRIGPGLEASLSTFATHLPMPLRLLEGLVDPVLGHLAHDLALPIVFAPDDIVLLDQNPAVRSRPGGIGFWVVSDGGGLRVRHARAVRSRVYTATALDAQIAVSWQPVSFAGQNILDVVRARVVWLGRGLTA